MFDRFVGGTSSLTVGTTGSGKSYGAVWDILLAALSGSIAIVVIDPHFNGLARTCLRYLSAYIDPKRILFDSFADFERILPYRALCSATGRNEFERQSLNDLQAQSIMDALSRRRDIASLIQNPQTEQMTLFAVKLLISQREPRPDADLFYAFWPEHPTFTELLNNCTDPMAASFFSSVACGEIKPGTYASAKRLVSSVYGNALYQARCGSQTNFEIGEYLERTIKQKSPVLLIEGGGPGVSTLAANSLLALILLQVTSYIRSRPKPFPKVAIWIDEATNANLIGSSGFETRAINELRKAGLDGMHILVQSPDFPNADVERSVLQNCRLHRWYQCSSDAVALKGAADLQDSELRSVLPQLGTGERCVKDKHGRVRREQVPPLRDPYGWPGMLEMHAEKALARIRKRPEFTEPPECNTDFQLTGENGISTARTHQSGGKGMTRSSHGRSKIQSSDDISTDSSPVDRLRRRDVSDD